MVATGGALQGPQPWKDGRVGANMAELAKGRSDRRGGRETGRGCTKGACREGEDDERGTAERRASGGLLSRTEAPLREGVPSVCPLLRHQHPRTPQPRREQEASLLPCATTSILTEGWLSCSSSRCRSRFLLPARDVRGPRTPAPGPCPRSSRAGTFTPSPGHPAVFEPLSCRPSRSKYQPVTVEGSTAALSALKLRCGAARGCEPRGGRTLAVCEIVSVTRASRSSWLFIQ